MSQFWYNDETSNLLAMEAISLGGTRQAGQHARIACVSCPSIFQAIKRLNPPDTEYVILEYDTRFEVYGKKFFQYDFNNPTYLPEELYHTFDFVVADPPYLNKDCMSKTGLTMSFLAKNSKTPSLFNTGLVMERDIYVVLNLRRCEFEPQHERNLANQFCTYSNYQSQALGKWHAIPKRPRKTVQRKPETATEQATATAETEQKRVSGSGSATAQVTTGESSEAAEAASVSAPTEAASVVS